ncbi:MAG: complex I NDUFA9 subunit family protein, partial [Rickettsiales bacterium]
GRQNFDNVHIQGAKKVAKEAWKCGAKYFVQVSAIGASNGSKAKYGRSKSMGEKAICDAFKGATIIRPSVLFGPEDDFFNKFAKLASWLPFLPLIGKGNTRFQPVYVADVARAIVATIDAPALAGKTYELGGPEVMTYKDILRYILKQTGRQRPFFSAPPAFWKLKAWFWELMPTPILTRDQIRMLAYDNVVDENTPGFAALGITPISLQMVVPGYLARYRKSQHIAVDAGDESPA